MYVMWCDCEVMCVCVVFQPSILYFMIIPAPARQKNMKSLGYVGREKEMSIKKFANTRYAWVSWLIYNTRVINIFFFFLFYTFEYYIGLSKWKWTFSKTEVRI